MINDDPIAVTPFTRVFSKHHYYLNPTGNIILLLNVRHHKEISLPKEKISCLIHLINDKTSAVFNIFSTLRDLTRMESDKSMTFKSLHGL